MQNIGPKAKDTVVNPSTVVLQSAELLELLGMQGRKSKERRLNIMRPTLLDGA
jgi:hypothetical protein